MVGVSLFQTYLLRGRFRRALWFTAVLKVVASVFDIVIVKRISVRYGVQDKVAFMLGDAIIYTLLRCSTSWYVSVLAINTLTLCSNTLVDKQIMPQGLEASIHTLLASYQNLGSNIARCLGLSLIEALQIKTNTCLFQKLLEAIFIAHVILPLAVVPLVFVIIPNANMTHNLMEDSDELGTLEGRALFDSDAWSPTESADDEETLLALNTGSRSEPAVEHVPR